MGGTAKKRQSAKIKREQAERRYGLFTILAFAAGIGSWGYFVIAPEPNLLFGSGLIGVSGLLFIVAVWEYFRHTWIRVILTLAFAAATYQSMHWARSAYSPSAGRGFMQLGYVRFRSKEIIPGERLSLDIWIKNNGTVPVDNMFPVFVAALVPLGSDPNQTDRETHSQFLSEALKDEAEALDQGRKGHTVGKGEGAWETLELPKSSEPPLTQAQVTEFMGGTYRLYVYIWARWRDAPSDLDNCQWLQPPSTNRIDNDELVWHLCAD